MALDQASDKDASTTDLPASFKVLLDQPLRVGSLRSMNSSAASAMMRFLSSEGWNEKSKPARVLIDDRGEPLAPLTAAIPLL
jgi:hypothetical protein